MPSNDIAHVVERSKELEERLRLELNATGSGLGELTHSVKALDISLEIT